MKTQPIDQKFRSILQDAANRKRYVKLQYFTDIHEFITVMAVVKDLFERNGEEYIRLHTDEEIRLDRIVRMDQQVAPPYGDIYDFTCDC